ncbi:MAG: Trm112 family protein [Deltaproteobacteria bacterium]|nr:MAG: Trm112 family protein [Deltaproteobacteria bacterium]
MALDRELLDILVCPKSKQPVIYFEQEQFLFCPASRLKYRIDDGIPVMLIEEAEEVDEAAAAALVAQARERGLM